MFRPLCNFCNQHEHFVLVANLIKKIKPFKLIGLPYEDTCGRGDDEAVALDEGDEAVVAVALDAREERRRPSVQHEVVQRMDHLRVEHRVSEWSTALRSAPKVRKKERIMSPRK